MYFLSSLYVKTKNSLCLLKENFYCCLWKSLQCIYQTVNVMYFSAFSQFHSHSGAHWPPAGLSDCFPAPGQQPTDRCIRSNRVDLMRAQRRTGEDVNGMDLPPYPPQPIGQTRCIDRRQWGIVLVPWSFSWELQMGQAGGWTSIMSQWREHL